MKYSEDYYFLDPMSLTHAKLNLAEKLMRYHGVTGIGA
jgi:hypothetical protein